MANLSDLARFGVTSLFGAEPYARGVQQRQAADQQRTRNRLLDLQLENAPEQIQRDNRLADLGIKRAEQGISLNEQKLRSGELDSDLENARLFIGALGSDFEQLDPESQQRQWTAARQRVIGIDPSNEDIPEMPERSAYRLIRGMAGLSGAQKPSAFESKLIAAGYRPGTLEFQEAAREQLRKPSGTTVNLNTGDGYGADKGEFLKALGKKQADQWLAQSELAQQADQNIAKAEEMLGILNRGLETGALAPLSSGINKFSQSAFGYNLTGLDPAEAERFEAISNQLAKQLRVPGEGVMTDKDFEIYRASTANLGATPQANRLAINSFVRAQRRNQEKAEQMDQWIKENGSMTGFQRYWNRYMTENPLYSEEEAARIRQMSGGAGSAGQILDDDTEAMLQELGV